MLLYLNVSILPVKIAGLYKLLLALGSNITVLVKGSEPIYWRDIQFIIMRNNDFKNLTWI